MSNVKKFLSSVGDVYFYDTATGTEIFRGKTLIDSSIEVALGNTDVRGGKGNSLLYTFYHSSDMNINVNDAQFNLEFIGAMVGSNLGTGTNVFKEENVTLSAGGAGTVAGGTPLALPGLSTVYGWVKLADGSIEKVAFTGTNFTVPGASGQIVCVRYYALASGARYIDITANMLPKIGRLVIDAQLNSSDVSTNKIGTVQIEVPKAQLQPNFTISMASDGVAQTPLMAKALVSEDLTSAACSSVPVLAKITEIIDGQNWYDGVVALAIIGGDFTLSTTLGTKQLVVYALRNDGSAAFPVPNYVNDLTFSSGNTGVATVSNAGIVTGVSAGTSLIKVVITAVPTIEASATVTVPA